MMVDSNTAFAIVNQYRILPKQACYRLMSANDEKNKPDYFPTDLVLIPITQTTQRRTSYVSISGSPCAK